MNQLPANLNYVVANAYAPSSPEVFQQRDPTPSDLQYPIQQRWFNKATDSEWLLVGFTSFGGLLQAQWVNLFAAGQAIKSITIGATDILPDLSTGEVTFTSTGGTISFTGSGSTLNIDTTTTPIIIVETLSDDNGNKVTPTGNNIQLVGHVVEQGSTKFSTVTWAGSDTHLLNINPMSSSRWIVDPLGFNGTHTTIEAAELSATSGDTIFILPGTYTPSGGVLTLRPGINLTAWQTDADNGTVIINGTCTMTAAGTVVMNGIRLQTNNNFLLAVTGSAASAVNLNNCYLNCTNNTGISFTSSNAGASISLHDCNGNLGTTGIKIFDQTSPGILSFTRSSFGNSGASITPSTCSAGVNFLLYSNILCAMTFSGTSSFVWEYSICDTSSQNISSVIAGGSGPQGIEFCKINAGTASGVSISTSATIRASEITSSNTNAITGGGTLVYAGLIFPGSSSTVNTTTQTTIVTGPILNLNSVQILSGTGSPSGSITAPQGSLYLRKDGSSTSTRAYINTDAGTTWTAITTVG
jgi:hypothetical protein